MRLFETICCLVILASCVLATKLQETGDKVLGQSSRSKRDTALSESYVPLDDYYPSYSDVIYNDQNPVNKRLREFFGKRDDVSAQKRLREFFGKRGDPSAEKRLREFFGKRDDISEVKRLREFFGKRSNADVKRLREFFGKRDDPSADKRLREFFGKRDGLSADKRLREFFGKRDGLTADKRLREFFGKRDGLSADKRLREFFGKRSDLGPDKRLREFFGKRDGIPTEKRLREFFGKRFAPEPSKRLREFFGKRSAEDEPNVDKESESSKVGKALDDETEDSKDMGQLIRMTKRDVGKRVREFIGKRSLLGFDDGPYMGYSQYHKRVREFIGKWFTISVSELSHFKIRSGFRWERIFIKKKHTEQPIRYTQHKQHGQRFINV